MHSSQHPKRPGSLWYSPSPWQRILHNHTPTDASRQDHLLTSVPWTHASRQFTTTLTRLLLIYGRKSPGVFYQDDSEAWSNSLLHPLVPALAKGRRQTQNPEVGETTWADVYGAEGRREIVDWGQCFSPWGKSENNFRWEACSVFFVDNSALSILSLFENSKGNELFSFKSQPWIGSTKTTKKISVQASECHRTLHQAGFYKNKQIKGRYSS